MIGDILRQNWSTLHSHSINLTFRRYTKAAQDKPAFLGFKNDMTPFPQALLPWTVQETARFQWPRYLAWKALTERLGLATDWTESLYQFARQKSAIAERKHALSL